MLSNQNIIIYDLEILRAIPDRNGNKEEGIEYCAGWSDHSNMGICVLCVYDYLENRYRVFCADNKRQFNALFNGSEANLLDAYGARRPLCVGFNNIPFDNAVLRATQGWDVPADDMCYDILRETWAAAGLGPDFIYPSHAGYGLDAICERTIGVRKTGNGAIAPVQWQMGDFGTVIDYCLQDVRMTKLLMDRVLAGEPLVDPKRNEEITLRRPI